MKKDQPLLLLTRQELVELTGKKRSKAMCRVLRQLGFRFEPPLHPRELPRVARSYFDKRFVYGQLDLVEDRPRAIPNFDAFKAKLPANDSRLRAL